MKNILKSNPILKIINSSFIVLPSPVNIRLIWNFGSLLILCLLIQIVSGFILSFHYCNNINEAFNSVIHINQNVNYGWIIHFIHINGASIFFICIYIHIGRNLYYNSFNIVLTWISGILILFILIATAFLGYVLPWGQISFWGATVITNLVSAIPYIGETIVKWLWGGFSINNATLNRFYSFHFILPFILLIIVIIHLTILHITGSNNPIGTNSNLYIIPFHNYFIIKDLMGFTIIIFIILLINLINPYVLLDPENFNQANPIITPIHIQPEWYFLFAYAILRSIPNKLGGVIALVISIIILIIKPFYFNNLIKSTKFYLINQYIFWIFVSIFIILTWAGSKPIEFPYTLIRQIYTIFYFIFYILDPILIKLWNKIIKIFK